MGRIRIKVFTIVSVFLLITNAYAITRYVATTGSDSNSCVTSQNINTPKQTIASALLCLVPGDTLYLRGGTYVEAINSDNQTIPTGTSWNSPITIASYPGETATLRPGFGVVINFNTYNSSYHIQYLIFDRLILDGIGGVHAVSFTANPASFAIHHIRIQNSELKNSIGDGVDLGAINQVNGVNSHHNEWLNNDIHHSAHSYGFYIGGDEIGRAHV